MHCKSGTILGLSGLVEITMISSLFTLFAFAEGANRPVRLRPGIDYIPVKSREDAFGILLRTDNPQLRAEFLYAFRKARDPYGAVIISLFLDDKSKALIPMIKKSGRICDFATESLDFFYRYPFGKLPDKPTLAERDARIKKWQEWFKKRMIETFGRDAPPPREKPAPSTEIRPLSEDKQVPKTNN